MLLRENEIEPFFKRLIEGEEKEITQDSSVEFFVVQTTKFVNRPKIFNTNDCLPSGQYQTKQIFNDSVKIERERMGIFLMYPPFGPKLGPFYYPLFRYPQNCTSDINVASNEASEKIFISFFLN